MDAIINCLRESDVTQEDGQELARHVEGESIDTEDVEERGPRLLLTDIDDIHQESLKQRCQATGHKDVAGAPDALVERKAIREQITSDDEHRADNEDGDDLIAYCLLLTDKHAAIESQQHMSHRGYRAQQTLWIDRTLMIDMIISEELQVGLSQDIDVGILSIAVAEDEYRSIYRQQDDYHGDGVLMIAEEGEERHYAVAEGDALHDSPDAEMTETEKVALDGVVEPVDEQSDDEEQHRTLYDTSDNRGGGFELRLHQREVTRDTHDEEEEGEDEIAGRHAVPFGVAEHLERLAPAVVYKDHAGHGDAAEDIETE